MKTSHDTVKVRLRNVPEIDTFTFYNPDPPTYPGVPSVVSLEQTYTRSGAPRDVTPGSTDPTSPLNWAGRMWNATSAVKFSVAFKDRSFVAHGTASSAPTDFGEMGYERNGLFLHADDGGNQN